MRAPRTLCLPIVLVPLAAAVPAWSQPRPVPPASPDLPPGTYSREPPPASEPPPATPPGPPPRSGFTLVPRVGVLLAGGGTVDADCTTTIGTGTCALEEEEIGDASWLLIEVDGLYHATPALRLGVGATWAPLAALRNENDQRRTIGQELSFVGVLEGVVPVSDAAAFVPRGQAGVGLLLPGGDLAGLPDDFEEEHCTPIRGAGGECDANDGSNVGFTFGLGLGFVFDVLSRSPGRTERSLGIRADLLLQAIGYSVFEERSTLGADTRESSLDYSTARIWLMGGVEL